MRQMVKGKEGRKQPIKKSPSRIRYEERHHVRSCRLDIETDKLLIEHLNSIGCSFADFVKDALGREESMVEKRVETLASRKADPPLEERVRFLENLVHEILGLTVDHKRYPPFCPRCDNQELFECEGREKESKLAHPEIKTWKCQKCGFFIDTYKRIEPASIKWVDPDNGDYIAKPKVSARHWLKGCR
jgi:hypothetical protein